MIYHIYLTCSTYQDKSVMMSSRTLTSDENIVSSHGIPLKQDCGCMTIFLVTHVCKFTVFQFVWWIRFTYIPQHIYTKPSKTCRDDSVDCCGSCYSLMTVRGILDILSTLVTTSCSDLLSKNPFSFSNVMSNSDHFSFFFKYLTFSIVLCF